MRTHLALVLLLAAALPGACGGDPELPESPAQAQEQAPGSAADDARLLVPLSRIDASVRALASADAGTRRRAEQELVAAGAAAAPRILAQLDSGEPMALAAAPNVLAAMGPAAVPHLQQALQDADPDRRVVAVMALLLLGRDAESAAPALLAARRDPDPRVRAAAEHAYKRAVGDTSDLDRQRAEHDDALRRAAGR